MRRALELRRALGIPRESPANAFDVCHAVGMELRFMDLPSLEGMFSQDPHPIVILPSFEHRPKGRVLFSCGHEVGHYQLGHKPTVDKVLASSNKPSSKPDDEIQADAFASSLLMTRQAINSCFSNMQLDVKTAEEFGFYSVSRQLGVGYTTLLMHCRYGLEMISASQFGQLRKIAPKTIRAQFLDERSINSDIVFVDDSWPNVPVELEVGDFVFLPPGTPLGEAAFSLIREISSDENWMRFQAISQGQLGFDMNGKSISIRIASKNYCGLFKFRYLEDPDEE